MEQLVALYGVVLVLCCLHVGLTVPSRSKWTKWRGTSSQKGRREDELNRHIERHFQRKRLDSAVTVLGATSHFNFFGLLWAAINAAVFITDKEAYLKRHILFFVVVGIITSPTIFRHLGEAWQRYSVDCCRGFSGFAARWRSKHMWLDLFYGLIMSGQTVLVMLTPECHWYVRSVAMVRMGSSVVNRNAIMCFLWNILYLVCKIRRREILGVVAPSFVVEVCYPADATMEYYWDDAFELLVIVATTWTVEQLARDEAISATTARAQNNTREALSSILDATCDAVLQLDADLVVLGHTPKLAAMLLRQDSSVDGMSLLSLFTQDGGSLVSKLKENHQGPLAMAFHANMEDTRGNAVPIHGFHTRFTDLDGSVSHLIGLSEARETQEPCTVPRLSTPLRPSRLRPEFEVRPSPRRRSVPPSGRGTPSEVGSNETGSLSSRKSGRLNNVRTFMCPDKQPTSKIGKELSILSLIERWNVLTGARDCCTYHAALRELLSVASQMRSTECFPLNLDRADAEDQCVECGLMACEPRRGGRYCTVCEDAFMGAKSASEGPTLMHL